MHYYAWSMLRSSSNLNHKMTKPEMRVIWTIGGICAISVMAISAMVIFFVVAILFYMPFIRHITY